TYTRDPADSSSAGLTLKMPDSAVGVPVRSELDVAPDSMDVLAEEIERTGDSVRTEPGVPKGRKRTGKFTAVRMPIFDRFAPTLMRRVPLAYVVPARDTQALRVLREHGIRTEVASRPWADTVLAFTIDSVITAPRPFQGHREVRVVGRWRRAVRAIPRGAVIVPMPQPLQTLAVYLLEPESDDGLTTWNYFDNSLRPGGTYPVLRLLTPPSPPPDS
ncbi:MAG TPA: hypothetical protein VM939_01520, partial [Gemmatimonadaceae bacterium]|nr:hypothetical protein [Gemmatimonadaceae bacterium]